MRLLKIPRFVKWIFPNKTWDFSHLNNNTIYLTFDDGPIPEVTEWILNYLKEENIKATFFCVADNVRKHCDIYARILQENHQTGNHTYAHENQIRTPENIYLDSINKASHLIKSRLFRPPYGRLNTKLSKLLGKDYHIIMWTFLTFDYDKDYPIKKIIRKAEQKLRQGDIIVLHDNVKTAERIKIILPEIVRVTREKGLKFGVIDESLFALKDRNR